VVFFAASRIRRFLSGGAQQTLQAGENWNPFSKGQRSGFVWPIPALNSAPDYCKLEEEIEYAIRPRSREFLTLLTVRSSG
jgi:hypothetical protein